MLIVLQFLKARLLHYSHWEFRSRFLELYHGRYVRPLRDYLIGSLEFSIPYFAKVPGLYNGLMGVPFVKRWLSDAVGMVDSPLLSRFDFQAVLNRWDVEPATPKRLAMLSPAQAEKSIVIAQDAFTRYFETPLLASFIELASRIGFQVFVAPYSPNGKPLHVQ